MIPLDDTRVNAVLFIVIMFYYPLLRDGRGCKEVRLVHTSCDFKSRKHLFQSVVYDFKAMHFTVFDSTG